MLEIGSGLAGRHCEMLARQAPWAKVHWVRELRNTEEMIDRELFPYGTRGISNLIQ